MANIQLIETCLIAEHIDNYPFCMFEYSDSVEFTRCEITGLMSDCVTVKIYKDQS